MVFLAGWWRRVLTGSAVWARGARAMSGIGSGSGVELARDIARRQDSADVTRTASETAIAPVEL
jgi:hypothetical protein